MSDKAPANFSWLLKNKLAGSARPKNDSELSWLWNQGIRAIVCLNKETPLIRRVVADHGFQYEFIPVQDFLAPSIEDMNRYIRFVKDMINQGKPVVTCCACMHGFVSTYLFFIMVMITITIGEMLVAPVGQALVANFAPEDMRGRYMAMFGFTWTIPFALGPLVAGLIMDNYNPNWIWYASGIVSMIAIVAYLFLHFSASKRLAKMHACG
jgi:hypothetical protein